MWLVTIFGAYIWIKEEYTFETIEEANSFLMSRNFKFDSFEEGIHHWIYEDYTFASIQKY